MKRIYKYPLHLLDEQQLTMPKGAELLTVQAQHNRPCLWALVDDAEREMEAVVVRTVSTGHAFPDAEKWTYLATYQLDDGAMVFHVFQSKRLTFSDVS